MRGDVVYRVCGVHEGREEDHFFGAFRTVAVAEVEIAKLRLREVNGRNWAEQYYNRGFVIRQTVVETVRRASAGRTIRVFGTCGRRLPESLHRPRRSTVPCGQ
jgi:hypothetical protein